MQVKIIMMSIALAGCVIESDSSDLETEAVESESSVTQWSGFYAIGNQNSEWQVGLAGYNGSLYMVHNGHSDKYELWQSTFGTGGWTPNVRLPWRSTGGPSLTVHNGTLKMVFRSTGGQLQLSTFIGAFQQPVTIGAPRGSEGLHSEPAATTFGGRLYVAYCTTGAIRVDRQDGTIWTNVLRIPTTACADVELAVIPDTGQLHLVYALTSGFMHETRSSSGSAWTTAQPIPYKKTAQPISIVTCNGVTHMVHGGHDTPNEIWWSERMFGQWGNDYRVANQHSYGGAALGCYPGATPRAMMVHNSWFNDLHYGYFVQ